MDKLSIIKNNFIQAIDLKQKILDDERLLTLIEKVADKLIDCYRSGGKILWCGNGGSAADAQHLAAELSGRYYIDRPSLNSEALHVNTSYLTAVANDYSFDEVYARLITALAKDNDVLIGLSTSGNSTNVNKALEQAQTQGCFTIGLSGKSGGEMIHHCDIFINIPSMDTPRIQECHMILGHSICEIVEKALFG